MKNLKKIIRNTTLLVPAFLLSVSTTTAQSAVDFDGFNSKIGGQLALDKQKLQNAQNMANKGHLDAFLKNTDGLPSPGALDGVGSLPGAGQFPGAGQIEAIANKGGQPTGISNDASSKDMLKTALSNYDQSKAAVFAAAAKYKDADPAQQAQIKSLIQNFEDQRATLEAIKAIDGSMVDNRSFSQDLSELKIKLGESKDIMDEIKGSPNAQFLEALKKKQEEEKKEEEDKKKKDEDKDKKDGDDKKDGGDKKDGDNKDDDKKDDKDGDKKEEPKLSPAEEVQKACSSKVGGVNGGAALVKFLKSGPCADALKKNPELAKSAGVDGVIAGLEKWQGIAVGAHKNKATLQGIGIEKLAAIGIIVVPGLNQNFVQPTEVASKAEQIRDDVKVASAVGDPKNPAKPDAKKKTNTDKVTNNASNLTD